MISKRRMMEIFLDALFTIIGMFLFLGVPLVVLSESQGILRTLATAFVVYFYLVGFQPHIRPAYKRYMALFGFDVSDRFEEDEEEEKDRTDHEQEGNLRYTFDELCDDLEADEEEFETDLEKALGVDND